MLQIFGKIAPPPGVENYGTGGDVFTGLLPFLNNIIRLIFVIAGLFAFFNLIMGGLGFISAGGDPKAIEKAWGKIYQSLIGLIIIVSSFVLSAIFGYILFGNAMSILNPKIYGPGSVLQNNQLSCLTCWKNNPTNLSPCASVCNPVYVPKRDSPECVACITTAVRENKSPESCLSVCF